jgi:prepilin-type N-terminal cleavage/methylation domain-containing protein
MRTGFSRKKSGFTLIEIIVALALLGLIVAAIYSSWAVIVRGSRTGLEAAAAVQRERVAVRTIEEALTCARSFAANIQYYSFVAENGDQPSLSFVAHLSKSFPRSGRFGDLDVRRVTFSVEPGPDSTRQLVLRQSPLLMDWDIDEQEHPVVLAKDVKDFKMEFWNAHLNPPDYVDEWTRTNELPPLILFTLELGSDPQHPNQARQVIARLVALPAVTVQVLPGGPGGPQRPPGGT